MQPGSAIWKRGRRSYRPSGSKHLALARLRLTCIGRRSSDVAASKAKRQSGTKSDSGEPEIELAVSATSDATDSIPLWWSMLPKRQRNERLAEAHKAWDLFWFVNGLSFRLIDVDLFRDAIKAVKRCPVFQPASRQTLAGSHLDARDSDADRFKAARLKSGARYRFVFTTDGWKNKRKHSYHNCLLLTPSGPIFLGLKDVTGESGTAVAVHEEIEEVFASLDTDILRRILIGVTDTPSVNRSAWKLLEAAHPNQVWIGCMAHEIALLFKDWLKQVPELKSLFARCKRIVTWVQNHGLLLKIFEDKVKKQWPNDKRKWTLTLYMPGDTRMVTMFKLLHRIQVLKSVLRALITDVEYVESVQSIIAQYNSKAKPDKKIPKQANGAYPDAVSADVLDKTFWDNITMYLDTSKCTLYLHRLVDNCDPVLDKVYYCCAMVGKHLSVSAQ